MQEIWKDVVGYEGYYKVSNLGNVKSIDRKDNIGRNRKGVNKIARDNGHGYLFVCLYSNNKGKQEYVHRLVANAFIENEYNKPEVHHKDSNRKNNVVDNLQWVTTKENNNFPEHILAMQSNDDWLEKRKQAVSIAREKAIVINSYKTKFTKGSFVKVFDSLAEGARELGLDKGNCTRVANGKQKHTHGYHIEYV